MLDVGDGFFGGKELTCSTGRGILHESRSVTMGDRSPKAVKKQASQKQVKTNSADMKKKQDLAAKAQLALGKNKKK
jgi:hypothetical protein